MQSKIAAFIDKYSELEARYPRELSHKELSGQLLAEYEESLKPECAPSHWANLSDADLERFFHAVQSVAFYSETQPEARDLGLIFAEAERRKMDVRKDLFPRRDSPAGSTTFQSSMVKYLYKAYMSSRLFDEARLLTERFPTAEMPLPPTVIASSDVAKTNRVFDFSADGRSMTLRSLPWDKGQRILVVFSPNCGFSQRAFDDIAGDAFLLKSFEAHALLIAAPSDILQAKWHVEWNSTHPALKSYIAYARPDWPELDLARTPQFYFFRDGKLAFQKSGWRRPSEDRKAELVKGLESIGLVEAPPATR